MSLSSATITAFAIIFAIGAIAVVCECVLWLLSLWAQRNEK